MPYAKAKKEAPALHPGMTPLVDTMKAGCSNAVKGKVKPCPARVAKDLLGSLDRTGAQIPTEALDVEARQQLLTT